MVEQLNEFEISNITIIDQNSTNPELIDYLENIRKFATVIKLRENLGPHWFFMEGLALNMPEFFVYTDSDLQFNKNLPKDFLSQLIEISKALEATKIGLALDISNENDLLYFPINLGGKDYTNVEWEQQFWNKPIKFKQYAVYQAPVDTTFALYQRSVFDPILKKYIRDQLYDCLDTPASYRVGGDFAAVHLPWSRSDPMPRTELDYFVSTRINVHKY